MNHPISTNLADATFIQNTFEQFARRHDLQFKTSHLILDGGNIVDNNDDMAIVSNRFLEDNKLNLSQGKALLKSVLGVAHVAIIPYDDEVMGHADGMVMFAAKDKLMMNVYQEPFRTQVLTALKDQLPANVEISEVPADFDESIWDVFASACGINLNSTVTLKHIYMPVFGTTTDQKALNLIKAQTDKTVHSIPAGDVCFMGGSVRCLTWQLQGENARKIIEAARVN